MGDVGSIDMAEDRDRWGGGVLVLAGSVQSGDFRDWLTTRWLFKKDFALLSQLLVWLCILQTKEYKVVVNRNLLVQL